jgi:hypothetical protein
MTNEELLFITDAIKQTVENAEVWKKEYCYDNHTNEFSHCMFTEKNKTGYTGWFDLS